MISYDKKRAKAIKQNGIVVILGEKKTCECKARFTFFNETDKLIVTVLKETLTQKKHIIFVGAENKKVGM